MSAPAKGAARVEFRELSVWRHGRQMLEGLSFTVPANAVTAIIGPSGSGKTTLLRMINRLSDGVAGLRVTGSIVIGGEDVLAPATDVTALRQQVGMVFQRWNPFPTSIFDNVAYGPRLAGVRERATMRGLVEAALQRAALWDEVKDRLGASALSLSGGQQQRLCIARALANAPRVLLLDEPCSALDPGATQRIEELLYELRTDLTIILVTHNLQQAARASDHAALLDGGRLVEMAPTRELFTRPRDPRTEAYLTGRFG